MHIRNKEMRVVHVVFNLAAGGAERLVTDLTSTLAEYENCDVQILMVKSEKIEGNNFYRDELSDKVKITCLGIGKSSIWDNLKIYRAIKNLQPDIVHYHGGAMVLFMLFSILFYHRPVYVETIHSEVSNILREDKIRAIIKKVVFKLRLVKVCTISDKNNKEFKRLIHRESDGLIYNGRRKLLPSKSFEQRKKYIGELKKNGDDIVLVHIARCNPLKNQQLLINSFNQLIEHGHNCILLIIGNYFDSEEGQKLQEIACNRIFFLGPQKNVQDYLLCADAFCLSSLYEGMPITLIEALSCGCVPLSTPVSGMTDLVINGQNGFIAEDFTEEAYLEMLENYVEKRNEIDKEELMSLYREKLSIESCAQQYYQLYCKFLELGEGQ